MRAVVEAQLVEWSLLTPEVQSTNPVIGKIEHLFNGHNIEKTEKEEKEAANGPFLK